MIDKELIEKHVDCIVDIIHDEIKLDRLTILVGGNGVGKSVIRKQMAHILGNIYNDKENHVRSISMQLRTESQPMFGALASIAHDSPYEPTGLTSVDVLNHLIKVIDKTHYYVIDEAEIGMSEESIYGLVEYLKKNMEMWINMSRGILLITHSRIIVEELIKSLDCDFINLGYGSYSKDVDEWLNRKIEPMDFDWLRDWSDALFSAIRDRAG